jgi:hypothetical protein
MTNAQLAESNRRLNAAFADIFRRMEQEQMEAEERLAKADPAKFKLSRTMARGKPLSLRHWGAVKDKRGRTIKFLWSCHRNVAGYFVAFRQVETPIKRSRPPRPGETVATIKRDQWTARKTKRSLEELQKRRTKALRAKLGK